MEEIFYLYLNLQIHASKIYYTDISCLGGVFAKKYQSRDEKFPKPNGEGNLVLRLVFLANTPPKHDISV